MKFVVIRRLTYGPFDSAKAAYDWADKMWPGEEHEVHAIRGCKNWAGQCNHP